MCVGGVIPCRRDIRFNRKTVFLSAKPEIHGGSMKKAVVATIASVVLACASFAAIAQAPKPHDVEDFIRKPKFNNIQISPTGEYYAATVPVPGGRKTALVIVRRSDRKVTATMGVPGDQTQVADFHWVSNERIVLASAMKIGAHEAPQLTGELFGVDADGGKANMLIGFRREGKALGSAIGDAKTQEVFARVIDTLQSDDKNVIISVTPFTRDAYTRAEKMDVFTGRRVQVAQVPVRNAQFLTDNAGQVRFALAMEVDRTYKLFYRADDKAEWKLISSTTKTGLIDEPVGFSADNTTAYLRVGHEQGPDSIVAWNTVEDKRTEILRDDNSDPWPIRIQGQRRKFILSDDVALGQLRGFVLMDGLPRKVFIDEQSSFAKLYRRLERAFANQDVTVTSMTSDGKLALVAVDSDRNPGDFYVFDTTTNKAEHLLSASDWIDPAALAPVKPISFKARDGLEIQGYLTSPVGGEARNVPLIILIHGGPFGIFDTWGFDREAQMLAAHGYGVLQVNFRGSGNHGDGFENAGRRQWGGKMQDDITDATKWAIQQGVADPARICLYGASYGGYASLMGVAKEPDLYRCAAGYVGAYDLPSMHTTGDIQERKSGENYVYEWIGQKEELAAVSPNRIANRIKAPVFLAAGGQDQRTPMKHTEMMEKALRAANVPVEAVYYPTEGHGFYKTENERDYYGKLLTFFQRHLGGRAPVIKASEKK
jgi:dipeptidyl aminopeptidase/acylaminoacyl peptidase